MTRVHKWSYYAQARHLVLTGRPLFREAIVAYDHGPVVADLWKAEKYEWPLPAPAVLPPSGQLVVDLVLEDFGEWTAGRLEARTHGESPWHDAWHDQGAGSKVISHRAILEYFEATGEAAKLRQRAFDREDADPAYQAEVDRIRRSTVHAREGRPIDDNVLAAWRLGAIDVHNDPLD